MGVECGVDEADGFVGSVGLDFEEAEKMEGIGVMGVGGEEAVVCGGGLGETAGVVVLHGEVENVVGVVVERVHVVGYIKSGWGPG